MMPDTVATVRGALPADQLGATLMHEHVFVLTTEHWLNYGESRWWDEEAEIEGAVTELSSLEERGITTIADPTVLGLGRYLPRIQRVAARIKLQIVVATGLYTYGDLPFNYAQRGPGTLLGGPDPMVEDFVRDIVEGIGVTGVRAGFLKCAVEHADMSAGVERTLRAVAQAHRETGAPVMVHTSASEQSAGAALGVLRQEGVDPARVMIGHAGDSTDLDYLMELGDTGAMLGMDRFGIDSILPTGERVATVAALAGRGYADRMVLSHDASCFIDWFGPDTRVARRLVLPDWHYNHICDAVLPALGREGVSSDQIEQMLVANPRRFLAGS